MRNVPPRQSHIFWKIVRFHSFYWGMGLNICWSNTIQTLSLSVKCHSKYIILGRSIKFVNQTYECSYISCLSKYSKTVTYLSNVMLWNICALIVCHKSFKPLIPRKWWSLSLCGMLVMCIRDHDKDIQRIWKEWSNSHCSLTAGCSINVGRFPERIDIVQNSCFVVWINLRFMSKNKLWTATLTILSTAIHGGEITFH